MDDLKFKAAQGLTSGDLDAVRQLYTVCQAYDGIRLKLNWNMLQNRSADEINDFICYDGDRVVGYLALYGFNLREIEINGVVHPDYRRRGVFSRLLAIACDEVARRGIPKLLFICDRKSPSGKAFVEAAGARYSFSEYGMDLIGAERSAAGQSAVRPGQALQFRAAVASDVPALAALDHSCFGLSLEEGADEAKRVERRDCYGLVVFQEGEVAGKAFVVVTHEAALVCGLAVAPEHRGKGLGRGLLGEAVRLAREKTGLPVRLEVACDNERALGLYQSCGFEVTTAYDYYERETAAGGVD